jgi:hypothetical protein
MDDWHALTILPVFCLSRLWGLECRVREHSLSEPPIYFTSVPYANDMDNQLPIFNAVDDAEYAHPNSPHVPETTELGASRRPRGIGQ